jgi:hypothetical protein
MAEMAVIAVAVVDAVAVETGGVAG